MSNFLTPEAKIQTLQDEFVLGSDPDMVEKIKTFSDVLEWPQWMSRVIISGYESGYYIVSDGISHPFGWQYGARFLHLKKSPLGVGHDLLYYLSPVERARRGFPTSKASADKWFRNALTVSGVSGFRSDVAYQVLVKLGFWAYSKHAVRRYVEKGYGQYEYIQELIMMERFTSE